VDFFKITIQFWCLPFEKLRNLLNPGFKNPIMVGYELGVGV
jgi:hypothetical protein